MRIGEMIIKDELSWRLNKFFQLVIIKIYEDR